MIDFDLIRREVEKYTVENFTTTTVVRENELPDLTNVSAYISVHDTTSGSIPAGISDNDQLLYGLISIHIYTSLGSRTKQSRDIASELSIMLKNKPSGAVEFSESELHSVPTTDKSLFYQQNLHLPYVYMTDVIAINC